MELHIIIKYYFTYLGSRKQKKQQYSCRVVCRGDLVKWWWCRSLLLLFFVMLSYEEMTPPPQKKKLTIDSI